MLARAGLGEGDLECGTHWPFDEDAMRRMAAAGLTPTQLHNNCSGKHAGFLCGCRHCGIETRGYVDAGHAWQEAIRTTMRP